MIEVTVNGERRPIDDGTSVEALVALIVASPRGVAVAIDREVVPRSAWPTTTLCAGQVVEIVTAAAGG